MNIHKTCHCLKTSDIYHDLRKSAKNSNYLILDDVRVKTFCHHFNFIQKKKNYEKTINSTAHVFEVMNEPDCHL